MVARPALGGKDARHGGILVGARNGIWHADPERDDWRLLAEPPYDPKTERFNDGKCDALGRFWVGTIYEPRKPPKAALYCFAHGELRREADGITNSIKLLDKQYDAMSLRIDSTLARYKAQFTQLDVMMSSMNSTSKYLTAQFDSMNANAGK